MLERILSPIIENACRQAERTVRVSASRGSGRGDRRHHRRRPRHHRWAAGDHLPAGLSRRTRRRTPRRRPRSGARPSPGPRLRRERDRHRPLLSIHPAGPTPTRMIQPSRRYATFTVSCRCSGRNVGGSTNLVLLCRCSSIGWCGRRRSGRPLRCGDGMGEANVGGGRTGRGRTVGGMHRRGRVGSVAQQAQCRFVRRGDGGRGVDSGQWDGVGVAEVRVGGRPRLSRPRRPRPPRRCGPVCRRCGW